MDSISSRQFEGINLLKSKAIRATAAATLLLSLASCSSNEGEASQGSDASITSIATPEQTSILNDKEIPQRLIDLDFPRSLETVDFDLVESDPAKLFEDVMNNISAAYNLYDDEMLLRAMGFDSFEEIQAHPEIKTGGYQEFIQNYERDRAVFVRWEVDREEEVEVDKDGDIVTIYVQANQIFFDKDYEPGEIDLKTRRTDSLDGGAFIRIDMSKKQVIGHPAFDQDGYDIKP